MGTCAECGGPLDPDVTHVKHDAPDARCSDEDCACPEVCAGCCTDPDCALREPQETTVTPEPLTDDEIEKALGWLRNQRRNYVEYPAVAAMYELAITTICRLVATVVQVRSQRDAAYEELQRHQLDDSYQVGHEHGTAVAARFKDERDAAYAVIRRSLDGWEREPVQDGDRTEFRWYLESGMDDFDTGDGYESMSPAEVDAVRRAQATTEETSDE